MRWWAIVTIVFLLAGHWLQPLQAQPSLVLINEVMHNPSSGPEWVELYNPGPLPVDLSGWRIDDVIIGGPHTLIAEGTVIPPSSLFVVPLSSAILNNGDPDQAQLSNRAGQIVDQSPLLVVPRDQTIARQPDGEANWQVGVPTPGAWNGGGPPSPTVTATAIESSPSPSLPDASETAVVATPHPSPSLPAESDDVTAT
ncbi:lamin tail domain-containing protein, partial [Chloroflexus sp.]|uniref:lamin tail domain-containing protein n=1 Tax=Chloroflexus sp. TaxID=1904827 RepID=UPI00298EF4E0